MLESVYENKKRGDDPGRGKKSQEKNGHEKNGDVEKEECFLTGKCFFNFPVVKEKKGGKYSSDTEKNTQPNNGYAEFDLVGCAKVSDAHGYAAQNAEEKGVAEKLHIPSFFENAHEVGDTQFFNVFFRNGGRDKKKGKDKSENIKKQYGEKQGLPADFNEKRKEDAEKHGNGKSDGARFPHNFRKFFVSAEGAERVMHKGRARSAVKSESRAPQNRSCNEKRDVCCEDKTQCGKCEKNLGKNKGVSMPHFVGQISTGHFKHDSGNAAGEKNDADPPRVDRGNGQIKSRRHGNVGTLLRNEKNGVFPKIALEVFHIFYKEALLMRAIFFFRRKNHPASGTRHPLTENHPASGTRHPSTGGESDPEFHSVEGCLKAG